MRGRGGEEERRWREGEVREKDKRKRCTCICIHVILPCGLLLTFDPSVRYKSDHRSLCEGEEEEAAGMRGRPPEIGEQCSKTTCIYMYTNVRKVS